MYEIGNLMIKSILSPRWIVVVALALALPVFASANESIASVSIGSGSAASLSSKPRPVVTGTAKSGCCKKSGTKIQVKACEQKCCQ